MPAKGQSQQNKQTQFHLFGGTHGIRPGSCRSGTHHAIGEHRSCGVPAVAVSTEDVSDEVGQGRSGQGRTYEFDRNLLVVEKVGALENDTKGSFTNFLAHSVVNSHHV